MKIPRLNSLVWGSLRLAPMNKLEYEMHLFLEKGGVQITQPKIFEQDMVLLPFVNDTDKFMRHQNSTRSLRMELYCIST